MTRENMAQFPRFSEAQYAEAVKRGLSHQDMLENIDNRADQLGRMIADSAKGSRLFSIEELAGEAQVLKAYRAELVDYLLGPDSPLREAA